MQIILNKMELRLAKALAKAKMDQNQVNGMISSGPRSLEIDLRGVSGELAVCKKYNTYPDMVIGPHYSGYDLIYNNLRVDVKTTKFTSGYLQAKLKKKHTDCDVFILVRDESPTFVLEGWIPSIDFLTQDNIMDLGYGDKFTLQADQLRPMEALDQYA